MSDYLKANVPLRTIEGSIAKVDIFPDFVHWSPVSGGKRQELEQKVERQNQFVRLTSGIPNLIPLPITIVDANKGIWKQPRAKGFNLDGSEYEVQGGGFADFFSKLTLSKRISAFKTYLEVLNRLHENRLLFNDHKPDSVFIHPEFGVSLPDTDKVISGLSTPTLWQQEVKNSTAAIENVFRSFFTRNKLGRHYVPRLFEDNITSMGDLSNGNQLLETIDFMVNDGTSARTHNGLMAEMVNEAMKNIDLKPINFQKDADHYIDLSPIQTDIDALRIPFPKLGYNTSTAELVAHMQRLKQRTAYFREKDEHEYSSKIL